MKIISPLLLILIMAFHCSAQQSDNPMKTPLDSAIDKLMRNYMKEGKRVGVSLGVHYQGQSHMYNYGETSPGSGKLPTSSSIYEIGSITKTFTGLLVAHAILEGKIHLSDDIRKYLPGNFPHLQYPNGDPVKIAYLLAHTARFPNSFGDVFGNVMTEQVFLDSVARIKPDTLLPFRYAYSNVGYQLLGMILEKVYQQPFAGLVTRYITGPLGMHQTKLKYEMKEAERLLKGYDADQQPVGPVSVTIPAAGALHSTVSDMLKYLHYQNQESVPAVKLTHRIIYGDVDREAYGFQWAIGKNWGWDQYIRTDGGTKGFRSFCVMYPLHQVSIVLLSNQKDDAAGIGLYKIATGIFGAIKKRTGSR